MIPGVFFLNFEVYGDDPQEELAKFVYRVEMKVGIKKKKILLYFGELLEPKCLCMTILRKKISLKIYGDFGAFFHKISLCEVPRTFFVAKWQKLGEGEKKKTEKTLTWSICLVETANLTARHRTNVACELDSGRNSTAHNVDCELASERTSRVGREEGIGGQSTIC
jgi:hypothetical protein